MIKPRRTVHTEETFLGPGKTVRSARHTPLESRKARVQWVHRECLNRVRRLVAVARGTVIQGSLTSESDDIVAEIVLT